MVTIKDVAKKSNYSVSSVSKALNGYKDISEPTREEIIKIANEIGYTANYHARALKKKCTYSIGILYTHNADNGFRNEFFTQIIDSIRRYLGEMGYDIILLNHTIGDDHKSYLEHALYRVVDGVCVVCADPNSKDILELCRTRKFPVVTIDMSIGNSFPIFSNNYTGMKKLVNYIISQGHRKIAYIHGMSSKITNDRVKGYLDALAANDIDVPKEYLREGQYLNVELSSHIAEKMVKMIDAPTCIIMPDDLTAIGTINHFGGMNIRCPQDISIAGYDGMLMGQYMSPSLTTIRQDSSQIGELASKAILKFIEDKGNVHIKNQYVDGSLTIGTSVANITT